MSSLLMAVLIMWSIWVCVILCTWLFCLMFVFCILIFCNVQIGENESESGIRTKPTWQFLTKFQY